MQSKPWLARTPQWGERQNLHRPSHTPMPRVAARAWGSSTDPQHSGTIAPGNLSRRACCCAARFPFDTKKTCANASSNPQPRVLLRMTGVTLKLLSQAKDFVEFMNPTLASSCNSCTRVLTPTESSGGALVPTRPHEWGMEAARLWLRERNLF